LPAFITVDLMTSNEIGQATREFDGKRERIIQSMQSTVSLSCFGRNSLAQCYKLKAIFQGSAFLSFLKSNHWGVIRFSDVRNLTATVGADYEERGQFDVVFSHHHIVDTPLEPIENVEQRTNHLIQQIGG
jgi:genome